MQTLLRDVSRTRTRSLIEASELRFAKHDQEQPRLYLLFRIVFAEMLPRLHIGEHRV
jgi:hypothetical protein